MNLAKSLKDLKYDKRMLDWNLGQGLITKAEYDKHIASLSDLSGATISLNLDERRSSRDREEMNGSH